VSVSLSFWAGGGASPGYVRVLNSRCSSSDHCNKIQALIAVLPGQQSSRLDLLFDSTLLPLAHAPALGHSSPRYSSPPTQRRGVWPYPVGRTVRCACDTCSATALSQYCNVSTHRSGNTDTPTSAPSCVQLKAINSPVIAISDTY
jgi:hypothetical protein